ncbi:AidA/PixA family protein [Photorhabdus stackebrandtii]|uniref:Inclusion body protein n=1 Tax=Photorhabdus stackebrandtii TaxID=1123042 RepID=A0A7X5QND5_9GAMM|nr:AidA/PixA family protein [Photorhabdus stackebrandtii]NHB97558.1 hypothetical protein [Photorhabdus stackebrandtii]
MSDIVDILVCVDAESIVNNYHLSQDPTQIDNKYVYYIVRSNIDNTYLYAPEDNATGEMKLTVNVDDTIRWRPISLTQQMKYSVLLYKMDGGEVGDPKNSSAHITYPQLITSSILVPYMTDENTYDGHSVTSYYHQSDAFKATSEQFSKSDNYIWHMSIYKGSNLVGYIWHDPFIIVKKS